MNELLVILLQQQAQEGGSAWSGMIMILAMIVIFYFFMIRPQSKRQKEEKKAREAMQKGDKVITAGGIHGRIKEIKDNVIMMEVAPGVVIKINKTSVFADQSASQAPAKQNNVKAQKKEDASKDSVTSDAAADLDVAAGKVAKK